MKGSRVEHMHERNLEMPDLADGTHYHLGAGVVDEELEAWMLRRGDHLVDAKRRRRGGVTRDPVGQRPHEEERASERRFREVTVPYGLPCAGRRCREIDLIDLYERWRRDHAIERAHDAAPRDGTVASVGAGASVDTSRRASVTVKMPITRPRSITTAQP